MVGVDTVVSLVALLYIFYVATVYVRITTPQTEKKPETKTETDTTFFFFRFHFLSPILSVSCLDMFPICTHTFYPHRSLIIVTGTPPFSQSVTFHPTQPNT